MKYNEYNDLLKKYRKGIEDMESFYWLIAVAVLLIIEITTLGLTTIWFAGGALVAFVASIMGVNYLVQFILFVVVSVILLCFTRPIAVRYFNNHRARTNYESIIGMTAKVTSTIDNFNQTGSANVNGQEWTARAEREDDIIEPGTQVKIVAIKGVKLIVVR
ncbi:NfeD family protein [Anaerosporobacter sp.]|uniref:NfeD family protein n=1 Tax=Anaerosporobacter sp. TaxID=1872529 RepID=UPI00286ECFFA|nr:NfeD family protein [Anaerosporobacter sp.]